MAVLELVTTPSSSYRTAFDAVPDGLPTVGVEEEFLLVEVDGSDLVYMGPDLASALAPEARFTPELRAAQIETQTPVCRTAADARAELTLARATLARGALGVARPLAAPVNPASTATGPATAKVRYLDVLAGAPWARSAFLACGMHVHVAVANADRAVAVHDALRSYLPLLGALAANSPVYGGADAGVASAREHLKQLMPRFGAPPSFGSWQSFERFASWGAAGRVIADPSYQWYDLRLNPRHGTIEMRVFDVQTDVDYAAALVALTQSLVSWLASRYDARETLPVHDHHRIHEALRLAATDGASAALPDLDTGMLVPVEAQLARLLPHLYPHAEALGCRGELESVWEILAHPGHERQRAVLAADGIDGLIDWLATETACSTPATASGPDRARPTARVKGFDLPDWGGWPSFEETGWAVPGQASS
jgi:glutamate---cysteine ligase / carboxylate-amine ligase